MKLLTLLLIMSSTLFAKKEPNLPRWETSSIGKSKTLSAVDELVQEHLGNAFSVRDAVKVLHPKVTIWKVYICYGPGDKSDIKKFVYVNWSWKTQKWEFIDLAKNENVETAKARGIPEEFVGSALFKYRGDYELRYDKPNVPKRATRTRLVQGKIKGVASFEDSQLDSIRGFYQSHNVKFVISESQRYAILLFYEDDGMIQQRYEVPNE